MIDINGECHDRARRLADEIANRRRGLAHKESGQASDNWAKHDRDADCWQINGMVIALTYMLGKPLDMQLAELFIADDPAWRAL